MDRRDFVKLAASSGILLAASQLSGSAARADDEKNELIIDTHQHLWDLSQLKLPWLAGAKDINRDFLPKDYEEATKGLNVKSIYMEVAVDPSHLDREAEYVNNLCGSMKSATIAAIIGGRPVSPTFPRYLDRHRRSGYVKGVRQVLHDPETPAGYCLQDTFVKGIQALGERNLSFDLCMRPGELSDGVKLARQCPDTRFVVDHCGNADVVAFMRNGESKEPPSHDPETWKRDIEELAKQKNVICKISGIIARAPKGWKPDLLAPIVNHCLDAFGPDRVVFGGDWPVCLSGAPLADWVAALRTIVASRDAEARKKLWSENAIKFFGLKV